MMMVVVVVMMLLLVVVVRACWGCVRAVSFQWDRTLSARSQHANKYMNIHASELQIHVRGKLNAYSVRSSLVATHEKLHRSCGAALARAGVFNLKL